jgi:hypothetical protein
VKLHLGVIDLPHPTSPHQTVGDVAEILEAKYHIMATFFAKNATQIIPMIEVAMRDAFEEALNGGSGVFNMSAAESGIETLFRAFISSQGLDGTPGVPTRAALKGVSHRRQHPYVRRGPRPSFIDTGTFVAAFKVWTEGGEQALRSFGASAPASRATAAEEAGGASEAEIVVADIAEAL